MVGFRRMLPIGAFAVTLIAAVSAYATTFVSAPVVLARAVSSGTLDSSTKVFGFSSIPAGGVHIIHNTNCGNPRWFDTFGDLFSGGGETGWDGDPAVAYSDTGPNNFWVCAHDSGGTAGGIYCQRGTLMINCTTVSTYNPIDANPFRIGAGTFDPGTSPALVRIQSVFGAWLVDLFARGQNSQIWWSGHFDTSPGSTWTAWAQLPAVSGGFDSAPAATYYSTGRVIVCARKASNAHYACINQEFGPSGSLQWGTWAEVAGYPAVSTKPALATDDSSIYLFGVTQAADHSMLASSLPIGGGAWSANTTVGGGSNFSFGPGAIRVSPSSQALVVGRGGDMGFWWATGSAGNWTTSNWQHVPTSP